MNCIDDDDKAELAEACAKALLNELILGLARLTGTPNAPLCCSMGIICLSMARVISASAKTSGMEEQEVMKTVGEFVTAIVNPEKVLEGTVFVTKGGDS